MKVLYLYEEHRQTIFAREALLHRELEKIAPVKKALKGLTIKYLKKVFFYKELILKLILKFSV